MTRNIAISAILAVAFSSAAHADDIARGRVHVQAAL
jgi:hypothetical protein